MGKRALFWAPAERDDDGPRRPDERDVPGKHALFSATSDPGASADAARRAPASTRRRAAPPGEGATSRSKTAEPVGGPGGAPAASAARRPSGGGAASEADGTGAAPAPTARGRGRRSVVSIAPVTLECSACGAVRDVDVLEYLVLHLPVWLWKPGKGYTRYLTCPACRRRTWVSASWTPWSR